MDTVTLAVPDLTGRERASAIEAVLQAIHGVRRGRADTTAGWVTVEFDPDSIDVVGIVQALQQHGYDVAGLIPAAARRGSAATASRPASERGASTPPGTPFSSTPHVARPVG